MKPKKHMKKDDPEKFIREVGEEGAANAVASAQECTGMLVNEPDSAYAYKNVMNLYQTENEEEE